MSVRYHYKIQRIVFLKAKFESSVNLWFSWQQVSSQQSPFSDTDVLCHETLLNRIHIRFHQLKKKNLSRLRLSHEHALWEKTNSAFSTAGMTLRFVLSTRCWQTATLVENETQAVSLTALFGGKTASEQHSVPQN